MLVEEYIQESTVNNVDEPTILMQGMELGGAEDDALSFCDLPIYNSSDDAESESQSSTTLLSLPSHTATDYFEFFSEELSKNSFSLDDQNIPENIIFCGKLIPSRKPISEYPQNIAPRKQKKWYYHFQCIIPLPLFYKRKISSRKIDNEGSCFRSLSIKEEEQVTNGDTSGNNISITSDKMSIIPSGRRSRWNLFLFGITKHPTKMDLSDLRNRRRSRQINSFISLSSSSSISSTSSSVQLKNGDASDEGMDFWWVIRALSCGGSHHAQAMVNASVGCFNVSKT